ncbi:unnamed protein product, partial [Meganyctiphanes norvegica]
DIRHQQSVYLLVAPSRDICVVKYLTVLLFCFGSLPPSPGSMGVPQIFGLLLALIFTLSGSAHAQDDSDNLECYQFTWPGVYEYEAVNESQVVDTDDWCEGLTGQFQMKENTLPCYLPFIYTDPPSRPPNITELNRICSQQYCEKYKCAAPQKCIKWSEFDVTG